MNSRSASGILGAADGTTSIAGVIAGGAALHATTSVAGVMALGGALAATVSMAGALVLSQDKTDWRAVGAMGVGTLAGAGLPAVPLLVAHGRAAWIGVIVVSALLAVIVGIVRARTTGRPLPLSIAQSICVVAAGWAAGLLAGGA